MNPPPEKILAIVGPTASGKTDYALERAREQDAELISVDSRQVYRHLRVGTSKPVGTWSDGLYHVNKIPYHLLDIWEPDKAFTAADFVRLAEAAMTDIRARGKKPILVGGTGLYYKALIEGLADLPPGDAAVREELRAIADEKGRPYLHAQLEKIDPKAAEQIPANNIQRVIRALEVHRLTGKPISAWHHEHQASRKASGPAYALEMVGLEWPKPELHQRIEDRCYEMLDGGMIEETEGLLKKGFAADCPALTGLGYPRIIAYLQGTLSEDTIMDALIGDTRAYAKRQMTWFRNQMDVTWKKL